MKIAFDLHNIRDGGGMNYIRNLLENADPATDGFSEVHLIGAPRLLAPHPDRPWIVKHGFVELDGNTPDGKHRFERLPVQVDEQEGSAWLPVQHGLKKGDKIVVSGAILIAGMM